MTSFGSLSLYKRVRFVALLAALLVCLFVHRLTSEPAALPPAVCSAPVAPVFVLARDTSRSSGGGSLERKALHRSRWHAVPGPAYLVYPLPRRPRQAQLDVEAARAAQLHKI